MIEILEKPDWVSWDTIHEVLWEAHAGNREKGINMSYPALPGDTIKEMIDGHGKMFIAIVGEKVVGTAAVIRKRLSYWCGKGDYAYLCFASVLPEYNGNGIYKDLCTARANEVQNLGLNRISFETNEANKRVITINEKNGYIPIDVKVCNDHYNMIFVKWQDGCPFSRIYCKWQFLIRKYYRKLRFRPGKGKRFGL